MTTLTKDQIDECFEADHQVSVMINLYELAFPDFEGINNIDGWPRVGRQLSNYIWDKFRTFDLQHHPNVLPAGLWLNKGWGEDERLPGWDIDTSNCEVTYKEDGDERT